LGCAECWGCLGLGVGLPGWVRAAQGPVEKIPSTAQAVQQYKSHTSMCRGVRYQHCVFGITANGVQVLIWLRGKWGMCACRQYAACRALGYVEAVWPPGLPMDSYHIPIITLHVCIYCSKGGLKRKPEHQGTWVHVLPVCLVQHVWEHKNTHISAIWKSHA
jgi:hypothetical protein